MTDLSAAVEAARADLAAVLPQLRDHLIACHGLLYVDQRRRFTRPDNVADIDPRAARCGSCEHRTDEHDPACTRDGCRCRTSEPWPSTVGWAQWTGHGRAEAAYDRACCEIQRANDALGRITTVPAHWASDVLLRPASRRVTLPLRSALYGVDLLAGGLRWLDHELPVEDASALLEVTDHVHAAVNALSKAEERLTDQEVLELGQRRCAVRGCHIAVYAKNFCRAHYERRRRSA